MRPCGKSVWVFCSPDDSVSVTRRSKKKKKRYSFFDTYVNTCERFYVYRNFSEKKEVFFFFSEKKKQISMYTVNKANR